MCDATRLQCEEVGPLTRFSRSYRWFNIPKLQIRRSMERG